MPRKKIVAIKVGSNVITNAHGLPDEQVIASICGQIKWLKDEGYQVLLISSGAVAAGKSIYQFQKKADTVIQRQVLASIGQVKLISLYREIFERHDMLCSQVLVTKEDFKTRTHYLNMQNCLSALLNNKVVPIINENDVVSVTELMFTDNDELAGLVSAMMNADTLVILTNVDGIYDGDPDVVGTSIMPVYDPKKIDLQEIGKKKSGFGRGGILTKCQTSEKIARMGIPVHIGNGRTENIVVKILQGEQIGTRFPAKKVTSSFKKYMGYAYDEPKGIVFINDGAKQVLLSPSQAHSLLPVGIVKVTGTFKKGDIIKIVDEKEKEIGLGLARYSHKKAKEVLGKKNQRPLIHYDHLYLH